MATYTPNLNLGKPEATDAFGNFRQLFNDNMDILDNGGGGNVYGAFIDTNRLITSGQYSSGSPLSYTATEDCFVYGVCTLTNNTSGSVSIDGVQVGGWYNGGGTTAYNFGFLVKNGQTITASQTFSGNSDYKVYGVTQGTSGIFTPIIYSDTERVVGVWRDNKPLYQRTFVLPNPIDVLYNSWTSMGVSVADGERVIRCEGVDNTDGLFNPLMAWFNNGVIECQTPRNNSNSWQIKYLSVWYTKTTDVAGSGNWNTDGVPTVHYSTSEQVIGTWLNGKPLYEISFEYHGNINANATTVIADLASLNIDDFVSGVGTGYEAGWGWGQLPANGSFIRYDTTTNKLQVQTASFALANTTAYFTIRYTKVTD